MNIKGLTYENASIKPMMISRYHFGWIIKDFENRTFKVDNSGKMTLLPDLSEVILDKSGNAIINVLPYQEELIKFARLKYADLLKKIAQAKTLDEELEKEIKVVLDEFKTIFNSK